MKRPLFFLMLFLPAMFAKAQSILLPNGDFENWTSTNYNDLLPWFNSNENTIPDYGFACVTRITGLGSGYGVRMETKASGTDTSAGFISNSDGDILNGEGGVPCNVKAVKLNGFFRYNIVSGDTAFILLKFKKNGMVISDNLYPITGSQSVPTAFQLPVAAMGQTPDSVIIVAVSGNELNSSSKAGSWIELDELFFDDGLSAFVVPDGDFENWIAKTYDDATDWINTGYGDVVKSTDKYTGSFAAKLVSKDDGTGYIEEASLTLGAQSQVIGMPFTKKVDTLTGYYKYATTGTDNGLLIVYLTDIHGTSIGSSLSYQFTPKSNYTYFEIPVSSTIAPANMVVEIYSSDYHGNPVDGSTLYIDNVRLKNTPDGIGEVAANNIFTVYPNPAKGLLYILPGTAISGDINVRIFDMTGKAVYSNSYQGTNEKICIPVQEYAPGLYQYNITNGGIITNGKFVKE